MSKQKQIDLAELFNGLQNQMIAQLNTNREFIEHPGSKGDALENVWIEWLQKYLPNRYCVNRAIVVDSNGELSDQMDLVIYDQQYTPFVFTQNGINYIPAEGIYGVFEVKPDLQGSVKIGGKSISYIEYAGQKVESVRKLKRTTTTIIDRGEPKSARALTKIIGGILTSVNTYSNQETITKHLKSLTGMQSLDMGCAVEYGSFNVDYKNEEDGKIQDYVERITQYYKLREFNTVSFSKTDKSLVTFFLQLSRYLQQSIGTVAAIDFSAYAKSVNFNIDERI